MVKKTPLKHEQFWTSPSVIISVSNQFGEAIGNSGYGGYCLVATAVRAAIDRSLETLITERLQDGHT